MKGTFVFLTVFLLGILSTDAQTYYYKYLYTVKKSTGMKVDDERQGMFITFTNGKNTVYQSKKDGTAKDDMPSVYVGFSNGMHIYKEKVLPAGPFPNPNWRPSWHTYSFSRDYSRMNYNSTIADVFKDDVRVYERSSEPEMQDVPDRLY